MKKCVRYISLLAFLTLLGCNSTTKNGEFVGIWSNEQEKCRIELNKDFTFRSTNVPLDVMNEYYLTFNKRVKVWQGIWSLENKRLRLTIDDSYYYLNVSPAVFSGDLRLSVKLLDESGGDMIYFNKE